jgi:hypothetical protein
LIRLRASGLSNRSGSALVGTEKGDVIQADMGDSSHHAALAQLTFGRWLGAPEASKEKTSIKHLFAGHAATYAELGFLSLLGGSVDKKPLTIDSLDGCVLSATAPRRLVDTER